MLCGQMEIIAEAGSVIASVMLFLIYCAAATFHDLDVRPIVRQRLIGFLITVLESTLVLKLHHPFIFRHMHKSSLYIQDVERLAIYLVSCCFNKFLAF